jgi:hypothetical protein
MLAVVVADVAGEGEYQFERRKFGSGGKQLRLLAEWLVANEIEEVAFDLVPCHLPSCDIHGKIKRLRERRPLLDMVVAH